MPRSPLDSLAARNHTRHYWHDQVGRCTYIGAWRDLVVRSLITLKARAGCILLQSGSPERRLASLRAPPFLIATLAGCETASLNQGEPARELFDSAPGGRSASVAGYSGRRELGRIGPTSARRGE
jgi:hypothetical protein